MNTNNQSALDKLVNSLSTALTKRPTNGAQKKKNKKKRTGNQQRSLSLQVPRNQGLNLTSSQFTATSPLILPAVGPGSTPGGIRVTGREMISQVRSTTPLEGQFQLIDGFGQLDTQSGAGNPRAFPRLSSYSPIYEYFVIHRVTYIFQSNQPTTAKGAILMAIDYDPTDFEPMAAIGMMRNVSSTMANIYSDCSLQGLKSLSRLTKYETTVGPDAEVLQSQQYKCFVAVEGVEAPASAVLGYIMAEYDIEFFTPQ